MSTQPMFLHKTFIGLALAAFVALIFVTTMVRMGQNTAKGLQQRGEDPVPVTSVSG